MWIKGFVISLAAVLMLGLSMGCEPEPMEEYDPDEFAPEEYEEFDPEEYEPPEEDPYGEPGEEPRF